MTISPEERRRFDRQVESLRSFETDGELSFAQARAVLGDDRDDENPPELELYRRARALGMARTSR